MAAVITASVINAFSSDRASNTQADAAKQASQTQADANRYAADIQYKMFQEQQALEKPWLDVGKNALARLSTGLERGGEFGTPFTQTNWQQDPGYAFRLEEGQRALDRSAAARGGLISGNALKAAQRYGQAMGSQEYQNAFDRYYREREAMLNPLQSLARVGQTTAQSLGGAAGRYGESAGALASQTGASSANALMTAGNARASAYGCYAQAAGQGLQGLYNNWGTIKNWFSDSSGGGGTQPSNNFLGPAYQGSGESMEGTTPF